MSSNTTLSSDTEIPTYPPPSTYSAIMFIISVTWTGPVAFLIMGYVKKRGIFSLAVLSFGKKLYEFTVSTCVLYAVLTRDMCVTLVCDPNLIVATCDQVTKLQISQMDLNCSTSKHMDTLYIYLSSFVGVCIIPVFVKLSVRTAMRVYMGASGILAIAWTAVAGFMFRENTKPCRFLPGAMAGAVLFLVLFQMVFCWSVITYRDIVDGDKNKNNENNNNTTNGNNDNQQQQQQQHAADSSHDTNSAVVAVKNTNFLGLKSNKIVPVNDIHHKKDDNNNINNHSKINQRDSNGEQCDCQQRRRNAATASSQFKILECKEDGNRIMIMIAKEW